jgi:MYXO-CTERM domain-containing protein
MRPIRPSLSALVSTSATALCFPAAALACGGLFCNNSTPVVQQQESILFAVDGGTTHMHVRIVYAGPPQEFGWLLPVPRGVETTLSSEGILGALDAFQATFGIGEWERQVQCEELPPPPEGEPGFDGADAGAPNGGGEIQVLSREPVGPYDRAILDARTVEALRTWLQENGYQIPEGTDDKLRPYIDQGAVFVAIKLLPGEDVGDIVPLHLSFPGDTPTIPIVPTSVAAAPDLGLAVHVLGQSRAVPLNYLHVQINEAAIDWRLYGPSNYTAVVAQAADEAGGQAFATDYAGRLTDESTPRFWIAPDDLLSRLADVHTIAELGPLTCELNLFDPDIARLLRSILLPPDFEGGQEPTFLDCAGPVANPPDEVLDGAALAERVRVEINEPRTEVAGLFASQPYLTRFTSSMSAEEMTEDPAFAFNADLADVSNTRQATGILYQCDAEGYYDYANIKVRTPSGLLLDYSAGAGEADVIARDRGMTIRQGAEPGAAVIERLPLSGPAVIQEDRTAEIAARHAGSGGAGGSGGTGGGSGGTGGSGGSGTGGSGGDGTGAGGQAIGDADAGIGTVSADVGGDSGCGCRTTGRGGAAPAAFGLLALLGLGRRRIRSRR